MQYEINSASRLPIYQQLVQQVREAIARGDLKPDEQLPSVRQLSRDLVINPNTVARAYTELEREGLLNNRPGRGVFVAEPKDELTKDARRRRLLESLDRFLTEAVHLGFSEEEVLRLVTTRSATVSMEPGEVGLEMSRKARSMTHAIVTERLTKYYGSRCVVNCLNLHVPAGTVYGFLGRNGAGKSTTIKMLLGMAQPNYGKVELLGHEIAALAARGARPHCLSGGGASALRLDDGRRGRAVWPLVPSPTAGISDWSIRFSNISRSPCGRSSAGYRTASVLTSPWPWRSPPIPTCSFSTIPRWAWIRSPAAIS